LNISKYQFIGFTLLSALLIAGCSSDSQNGQQMGGGNFPGMGGGSATSVEVIPVERGSISDQVRAFGSVRPQDVVSVTPQVSNRVTRIHADLGDTVQVGQLLAKIYDVPFRDAYQQAQAQFRQNQTSFNRDSTQFVRQEQLYESGSISSSEFEEARATFENSRAQLEAASASLTQSREDLENTEIRSPVNGVVLSRTIAEGDVATTGQAVFEVANLVGYETRLHLPMRDWESVNIGQPVELRLSSGEGLIARGTVSRISPQLSETTGLGEVVVSLTEVNPRLRQGMLAESRITLETRDNTIIIPRSALIERVDTYIEPETNTVELRRSYSAFIAEGDSIARQKELTLGLEQGERVEVLSGIEEGQSLIITGQSGLREGARLRVAGQQRQARDEQRIETMEQMRQGQGGQGQRQRQGSNGNN